MIIIKTTGFSVEIYDKKIELSLNMLVHKLGTVN